MGEYIPAARGLLAGRLDPGLFQFRGFGYPCLLAASSWLTGGNFFLAARLLNVVAAVTGAWFSFVLFRDFLGPKPGLFVLLALLVHPAFSRATIEAGTDMPAFALSMATTYLVLRSGKPIPIAVAGFLAGYAYITRYNAVCLVAAGLLVLGFSSGRRRLAIVYGLGCAVPVVGWWFFNRALTGDPWTNRNYLNVAYAVYGRNVQWDRFWSSVGTEFHSFGDVLRYDPRAFAAGIARNLVTHLWLDLHKLVPWWLGVFAIPGMVLWWGRRTGWRGVWLHYGLNYLALSAVFYVERFFLYLAPFYLAGAATVFFPPRLPREDRWHGWVSRLGRLTRSPSRPVGLAVLLIASAIQAAGPIARLLSDAPFEVGDAARRLSGLAPPGTRVMARKPHVPYLAGMDLVRFPSEGTLGQLMESARRDSVGYVYYSGMEAFLRPDLQVLFDPDANLPGFRQVAREDLGGNHWYALYAVDPAAPDPAALETALVRLLRKFVDRHPTEPVTYFALAGELIRLRSYPEALAALSQAERLDPEHPAVATLRAQAYVETGRLDEGARAAERGIELGANRAWCRFVLGQIELRRGHFDQAREHFHASVELEPTNVVYRRLLGLAELRSGDAGLAARELERALALDSGSRWGRLLLADAYRQEGESARARALASTSSADSLPPLPALIDSLWVELR